MVRSEGVELVRQFVPDHFRIEVCPNRDKVVYFFAIPTAENEWGADVMKHINPYQMVDLKCESLRKITPGVILSGGGVCSHRVKWSRLPE